LYPTARRDHPFTINGTEEDLLPEEEKDRLAELGKLPSRKWRLGHPPSAR